MLGPVIHKIHIKYIFIKIHIHVIPKIVFDSFFFHRACYLFYCRAPECSENTKECNLSVVSGQQRDILRHWDIC